MINALLPVCWAEQLGYSIITSTFANIDSLGTVNSEVGMLHYCIWLQSLTVNRFQHCPRNDYSKQEQESKGRSVQVCHHKRTIPCRKRVPRHSLTDLSNRIYLSEAARLKLRRLNFLCPPWWWFSTTTEYCQFPDHVSANCTTPKKKASSAIACAMAD